MAMGMWILRNPYIIVNMCVRFEVSRRCIMPNLDMLYAILS